MINVAVPGVGSLCLKHLVLDYNGTIAFDGNLCQGVEAALNLLAEKIKVYIITADTFGTVAEMCKDIDGEVTVLTSANGTEEKGRFVESLGAAGVVAIGNGANDSLMLKKAALGIVVMGNEGAAVKTIIQADIVVQDINDALGLLLNTQRLIATLRV
ncbi:ATPase P [Peptococcaceae bacterium 1198_IL3148]